MGIRSIHPQGKLTWLCTLYWLFPFPHLPTHSLTHSNTYLSSYFRSTQTETVVMSPELTFLKTSNFQNYFLMLSISFGFSDTWIWCGSEFWMSAKQYSASKASERLLPPTLWLSRGREMMLISIHAPGKIIFQSVFIAPRLKKEHLSYSVPWSGFILRLLGLWYISGSGSILSIISEQWLTES